MPRCAAIAAASLALLLSRSPAAAGQPPASQPRDAATQLPFAAKLVLTRTSRFDLFSGMDAGRNEAICQAMEAFYEDFRDSFRLAGFDARHSTGRLVWVCFDKRRQFDEYALGADRMDMSWSDGYYSARTNRVALTRAVLRPDEVPAVLPVADMLSPLAGAGPPGRHKPVFAAVQHEAAHQLAFNCGLQKRGVMYPLWMSEGLATNMETPARSPGQVIRDNPVRLRHLAEARKNARLMTLEELAIMTRVPPDRLGGTNDVYAQAWALFRLLFRDRREQLRVYLKTLESFEPGWRDESCLLAEFTAAFGPIEQLERPWAKYLAELTIPPP